MWTTYIILIDKLFSNPKDAGCRRSDDGLADQPEVPAGRRAPYLQSDRKSCDAAVETPADENAVGGQGGSDVDPRGRLPDCSARVQRRSRLVADRQRLW